MTQITDPSNLRRMAQDLLDLADHYEANASADVAKSLTDKQIASERGSLALRAKRIYTERQRRREVISLPIFDEPAWDMLLDLYWHRDKGQRISVTSACIASQAPMTTALRYVSYLEEQGWVRRLDGEFDKRLRFLELSDTAVRELSRYLSGVSPKTDATPIESYLIEAER